jgi:cobalt-zinc-cadmium efflux system outer membrane protein
LKAFYPIFFLFFACSCNSKKYEETSIFQQIQEKAFAATKSKIYWNRSDDLIAQVEVKDLLKSKLSEKAALQIAILNNPSLQAEYERIGLASANYAQAHQLQNPLFLFNYEFSTSSSISEQINFSFVESILQMLLIPLKKEAAKKEIEIVKSEILEKIIKITAKTQIAFHNLQVNYQILKLRKKICNFKTLAYQEAVKLRETENISELKLTSKKRKLEEEKLNLQEAKNTYQISKEYLNNLLGLWGGELNWKFEKSFPQIPLESLSKEEVENQAITNSLSLKAAFALMKKRAAELKIDKANIMYQDIAVGIVGNYQDGVWFPGPQFNLNVPIFDIGVVYSHKAKSEISYLWKSFIAKTVNIRSFARKVHLSYLYAYQQANLIKNSLIPISEKILKETKMQNSQAEEGLFALYSAKESKLSQKALYLEKEKEFFKQKIIIDALSSGIVLLEDEDF